MPTIEERKAQRAATFQRWYADPENRARSRERSRLWDEANRAKRLESQRAYMHRKRLAARGLTPEDHAAMVEAQGGLCLICGEPPADGRVLVVDHDHRTGEIRGLLCTACNVGIGNLRDDPDLLRRALRYLEGDA